MTSDDNPDLKHLHGQLTAMLDEFTPPAAPTEMVKRRGRAIRNRRRAGAAAGLSAHGTIDGKPWRITLSREGKDLCVGTSANLPQGGCGRADSYAATWPAA